MNRDCLAYEGSVCATYAAPAVRHPRQSRVETGGLSGHRATEVWRALD
jgi:hypothetical protein